MRWWVITSSGNAFGPYDSYEAAFFFASVNIEPWTWTIAHT